MSKKVMQFEFEMRSSVNLIYPYLATPSGLSAWFCNDVNIKKEVYTFFWEGDERSANILKSVQNKLVRFHWLDTPHEEFFEFELTTDEITGDVAIIITDFVEAGEEKETQMLWESQIHDMKLAMGAG